MPEPPLASPQARRPWRARALGLAAALLTTLGAFLACSEEQQALPGVLDELPSATQDASTQSAVACVDGAERECTITLARQGELLSCYHGRQSCVGGAWGACRDGSVEQVKDPGAVAGTTTSDGGSLRTLALSLPQECVLNPCNPACRSYRESPEGGVTADAAPSKTSTYSWVGGSVAGLPGGLVTMGIREPCQTGSDCEFNRRCDDVSTDSACVHSKCSVGVGLAPSCDRCVSSLCASKPECCHAPTSCAHEPCVTGVDLSGCKTTDACVAKVCAARDTCCGAKASSGQPGTWDASCVGLVASLCGVTCPCSAGEVPSADFARCYKVSTTTLSRADASAACQALGGDLASIGSATENSLLTSVISSDQTWIGLSRSSSSAPWTWSSGESVVYTSWKTAPTSASDNCAQLNFSNPSTGKWTTGSCSTLHPYVCERPSAWSTVWNQSCIDAVSSVCGATCSTASPPVTDGACKPWLPGEVSTTCTGIDLSVDVPCQNTIPVCNHGQKTAPKGIRIIHYPANSNQYPKCAPDETSPVPVECFTKEQIPPGQCISVTDCPGLIGNREIMVNPPGAAYVAECSCLDNWSIYSNGTCNPPACGGFTDVTPITCSHSLPDPSTYDTKNVRVSYTVNNGNPVGIHQVSGASACGAGGWYLDPASAPTSLVLCPATCTQLQATNNLTLSAVLGCQTQTTYVPTVYKQTYQATCPTSQTPQWGFFTWYSTTPGDAKIEFSVATATSTTGLSTAAGVAVGTAAAGAVDTQTCDYFGPTPPCPIDLYAELGGLPAATYPALELRVTLYPSTSSPPQTPVLSYWELTYSCVDML